MDARVPYARESAAFIVGSEQRSCKRPGERDSPDTDIQPERIAKARNFVQRQRMRLVVLRVFDLGREGGFQRCVENAGEEGEEGECDGGEEWEYWGDGCERFCEEGGGEGGGLAEQKSDGDSLADAVRSRGVVS